MKMKFFVLGLLLTATLPAGAASIDTVKFFSKLLQREIPSLVIRPARPPQPQGLPVVYVLHGFGGNYALWEEKVPALTSLADQYNCLVVCPDGGRMTLYFDNPIDSNYRFESWFMGELLPYIETHFPVAHDRQFRAICGNSMGGFGALFLASRHPETFSAAGSMSGVLNLENMAKYSILAKKQVDADCCSINWKNLGGSLPVALSIECGREDYLLAASRAAHNRLDEMGIAHDYTERPGKHEWSYWDNAIRYQFLFFSQHWEKATGEKESAGKDLSK